MEKVQTDIFVLPINREIDQFTDESYAKCNLCGSKLSYKTTTTNLKRHMEVKHPEVSLIVDKGWSAISNTPTQSVPFPKENSETEDGEIDEDEIHFEVPPCDIKEEDDISPDTIEPSCPPVRNHKRPSSVRSSSVAQEERPGENPFDFFGKYVAAELHHLPERQAILVQQELQNCITKARLACLD
ncbi:uncharacterized protein LOC115890627 [Sitophilus oryzae]|uniref:Uncharacterized protein LOC115890627 n=1 Tax=Sitophilus oryzae TaxID=7048 RepID=A0A6J2YRR8_SITOR|nr:uncharacterized protein LOC115890627 [Sitophilus oryzae]